MTLTRFLPIVACRRQKSPGGAGQLGAGDVQVEVLPGQVQPGRPAGDLVEQELGLEAVDVEAGASLFSALIQAT